MNDDSTDFKKLNDIARKIKDALDGEGFLLSSRNPFFDWVRGENAKLCRPEDLDTDFFIVDPPVPKIAPFDLTSVHIWVDSPEAGGIGFSLTLHFSSVVEPLVNSNDIHNIYDKHDNDWFVKIADYFSELQDRYNLSWDTGYDVTIEDSLYGQIPLESFHAIPLILQTLRQMNDRWSKDHPVREGGQ